MYISQNICKDKRLASKLICFENNILLFPRRATRVERQCKNFAVSRDNRKTHSSNSNRTTRKKYLRMPMVVFNESNSIRRRSRKRKKEQSHFTHHHYHVEQCFLPLMSAVILTKCQSIKTPSNCNSTICNRSSCACRSGRLIDQNISFTLFAN